MTTKKETPNEGFKRDSRFLRGDIADELRDLSTGAISPANQQLLKFLGATLQDNRDTRIARKKAGQDREYSFMVRLRLPGGEMTPQQWLRMDELADRYGDGTLKLTTRQAVQLHGVIKRDLKKTFQDLDAAALTCIASSGDATRNVMVSVCRDRPELHRQVSELAREISRELEPRTNAYRELWLDGVKVVAEDEEPLYGATYLPRKFKIGFAIPPENDVDVYTHDLGFVAVVRGNALLGFNVLVGGGQGCANGNKKSFPRMADDLGFVRPDQVKELARQALLVHRDFSDRTDRKLSRLRYTIAERGLPWFRAELERRLGWSLEPARRVALKTNADDFRRRAGSRTVAVVTGGRVSGKLKEALASVARIHKGLFWVTGNQNLVLTGVAPETEARIDALLRPVQEGLTPLRLRSSACTALPFCPQGFTDSERALPVVQDSLDALLRELRLARTPVSLRMSGCPNGCSRPYVAEIGLVGRAPGKYDIWLGGAPDGSRLGARFREGVPLAEVAGALRPVLEAYANSRAKGESFGDWCHARWNELTA